MALHVLPDEAQVNALHMASVAYHEIDYVLTWNCKHCERIARAVQW
ncbi:MAG: hypothetical protein V2I51_10835 [Anderseniella sp.]|jgi:hypothetical protein|nr:hypothetical protein [Anderseniella sp.]